MAERGVLHSILPALIGCPSMWLYQEQILEAVRAGQHGLVATGTGSGENRARIANAARRNRMRQRAWPNVKAMCQHKRNWPTWTRAPNEEIGETAPSLGDINDGEVRSPRLPNCPHRRLNEVGALRRASVQLILDLNPGGKTVSYES